MHIELRVSAGELVDRLTILELKQVRLSATVRAAVAGDLRRLRAVRDESLPASPRLSELAAELAVANATLWDLEESLRECERTGAFDARFVALARQVYLTNDRRAALKRSIDVLVGSEVREYKSHALPSV